MAKLNTRQQQHVRDTIQASMIKNRLENHVSMEVPYSESGIALPPKGFMTPSQIQAAKILLDKALSNAPTEIISEVTADVNVVNAEISREWIAELISRANDKK